MSPELSAALKSESIFLALKRLHTYQRLRELGAPPVIIERASNILDQSKNELGPKYNFVAQVYFAEFRQIEDAKMQAQDLSFDALPAEDGAK